MFIKLALIVKLPLRQQFLTFDAYEEYSDAYEECSETAKLDRFWLEFSVVICCELSCATCSSKSFLYCSFDL
jgi:hypothetical protein